MTHNYDSRLEQDPYIIMYMFLGPIIPFASGHHCKWKIYVSLFELCFNAFTEFLPCSQILRGREISTDGLIEAIKARVLNHQVVTTVTLPWKDLLTKSEQRWLCKSVFEIFLCEMATGWPETDQWWQPRARSLKQRAMYTSGFRQPRMEITSFNWSMGEFEK